MSILSKSKSLLASGVGHRHATQPGNCVTRRCMSGPSLLCPAADFSQDKYFFKRCKRCRAMQPVGSEGTSNATTQEHHKQQCDPQGRQPWSMDLLVQQTVVMFLAGACLGPLLDNQHSRYHVLKYTQPLEIPLPLLSYNLETCWWVPLLFGLAGIILGVSYPLLDSLIDKEVKSVSWLKVYMGIAFFVIQYWLSGSLEGKLTNLDLLTYLTFSAAAHWLVFDFSKQGWWMSSLTAACGPLIELVLINQLHLYHYNHPQFFGIPNWIFAVYFCGGPAVGNLGRAVYRTLALKS